MVHLTSQIQYNVVNLSGTNGLVECIVFTERLGLLNQENLDLNSKDLSIKETLLLPSF